MIIMKPIVMVIKIKQATFNVITFLLVRELLVKYKTAIVTGASRGLGKVIAKSLVASGLNVMLASRSGQELKIVVDSIEEAAENRVAYTVVDLRSPESIRLLFERCREQFGAADILVNNAGIGYYKPVLEWSDQEIIDMVMINLTAMMLCSKAALTDMVKQKRGFIINIASDLSRRYLQNMAPYVATKFGVLGFSGSLLREVKSSGIKISTVMPGIIDTNFNNSQEGTQEEAGALRPQVIADVITNMLKQPDSVVMDEVVIHPLHQDF